MGVHRGDVEVASLAGRRVSRRLKLDLLQQVGFAPEPKIGVGVPQRASSEGHRPRDATNVEDTASHRVVSTRPANSLLSPPGGRALPPKRKSACQPALRRRPTSAPRGPRAVGDATCDCYRQVRSNRIVDRGHQHHRPARDAVPAGFNTLNDKYIRLLVPVCRSPLADTVLDTSFASGCSIRFHLLKA
jgi:hypothetical protein